ncbi:Translation initiation factor 2 OS=Stutzerimonas stutzeri OX=316 GN=CXK95_12950 PE=4 SV=1 [Stutzerimonas stutzeri]
MIKPLWLAGALLVLTACDKEPSTPPAPAKTAPPALQTPAAPQQAAETPPDLKIEVAPATEQADETKPPVQISVPKPSSAAPAHKAATPEKLEKIEEIELTTPRLDLSLPEDWAKEFGHDESAPAMSLLPPLFSEPTQSVQMSGRLITGDEEDDPLIEGAEIQFEFRR